MIIRPLLGLCLFAAPAVSQSYFGYAGVICGLEGPSEDFATEVAPFTNIAHVCPTGDIATDAVNLARAYELGMTPLYHAEPIFFERGYRSMWRRESSALWQQTLQSIAQSSVPASEIIFYLADEPSLMRLWPHEISQVIRRIQTDLPGARTMVVDAFRDRHPPQVPRDVDYWGFNSCALLDPATDAAFMRHLETAMNTAHPSVQFVLVMDATYTPIHAEAGLAPEDMAQVARNYAALAEVTPRIEMLLAYAWPGGIEWEDELGTRDLPETVREAHEVIGLRITGRD